MPRLFVAIELPAVITEKIVALRTDIPTARWVKAQQMHLTLRFIGDDVLHDAVESIKEALAQINAQTFPLEIGGVGRFPPAAKKAPRVLWVGIGQQPALNALHDKVESALEKVGFQREDRDFNPHITLARLKLRRPAPEATTFLEQHTDFVAGSLTVERFILFNSTLTPQGPRYKHEAVFDLR